MCSPPHGFLKVIAIYSVVRRGAPVCAPEIGNRRFSRINRFDRTARLGEHMGSPLHGILKAYAY